MKAFRVSPSDPLNDLELPVDSALDINQVFDVFLESLQVCPIQNQSALAEQSFCLAYKQTVIPIGKSTIGNPRRG